MKLKLTALIMFTTVIISSSCVSEFNNKHAGELRLKSGLLESSCHNEESGYSDIYHSIKKTYNVLSMKHMKSFLAYVPQTYTVEKPMLVSEIGIENRYAKFMDRYLELEIAESELIEAVDEISQLYFEMLRFETQKCSFASLAKIEHKDIRNIMDAQKYCKRMTGDHYCQLADGEVLNFTQDEMFELQEKFLSLCSSKSKRRHHCLESYVVSLKNSSTLDVLGLWIKELSNENRNHFKLMANSSKFTCEKDQNENTVMKVNVFSEDLNEKELRSLLDYSQKIWVNTNLKIKFEVVEKMNSDVVIIKIIDKMISYVPHSSANSIYLSRHLSKQQSRLILAHEFGHVLGFPDCYMEFYSKPNKELVYYELDHKENLMCAVGANHRIPKDYFTQLKEKSCNWN